jgi:endonuclease/exonuclease/phosphatase family metal-dependent hydrolase
MRRLNLLCAALLTLALSAVPTSSQEPAPDPITVMSFNIRYGTAKDGENAWPARRDMLFDMLRQQDADLIGLQEALDFQLLELIEALPMYAGAGVGRDDGRRAGEFSAILFKKDRFRVAGSETFWFSDTPGVPGSTSWGNNITRICTWTRFIDRTGGSFYHFNLHLDHQSQASRERSTVLLRERIDQRAFGSDPVIVTGDFNVGEDNQAIGTLTRGIAPGAPGPFVDTFRVLHPGEQEAGTFSGFKFPSVTGPKIDYVLVQPGTEVLSASIVRASRDGRYPSDHFPVVARVKLPPPYPMLQPIRLP